jgi:hypothetical protein
MSFSTVSTSNSEAALSEPEPHYNVASPTLQYWQNMFWALERCMRRPLSPPAVILVARISKALLNPHIQQTFTTDRHVHAHAPTSINLRPRGRDKEVTTGLKGQCYE